SGGADDLPRAQRRCVARVECSRGFGHVGEHLLDGRGSARGRSVVAGSLGRLTEPEQPADGTGNTRHQVLPHSTAVGLFGAISGSFSVGENQAPRLSTARCSLFPLLGERIKVRGNDANSPLADRDSSRSCRTGRVSGETVLNSRTRRSRVGGSANKAR